MSNFSIQSYIDRYVAHLQADGAIKSESVRRVFAKVPRHCFLDSYYNISLQKTTLIAADYQSDEFLARVYSNNAVVTEIDAGMPTSSMSQPALVARMLEQLALQPGMKVLEIGAGTGYNAALMAELVGRQELVVSVDIQPKVVERTSQLLTQNGYVNVRMFCRDGAEGVPEAAPFDRVVATVGCPDLSPQWEQQLAAKGFMLIPLMLGGWYPLVRIWKDGADLLGKFVGNAGFMLMQGKLNASFWPHVHGTVMSLEGTSGYPTVPQFEADHVADFHKFLALSDRRTFCNYEPKGYGLYASDDEFAILLIEGGEIVAKGGQQLYRELCAHYSRWTALGRPVADDWLFKFVLREQSISEADATIVLTRKKYQQVAYLS